MPLSGNDEPVGGAIAVPQATTSEARDRAPPPPPPRDLHRLRLIFILLVAVLLMLESRYSASMAAIPARKTTSTTTTSNSPKGSQRDEPHHRQQRKEGSIAVENGPEYSDDALSGDTRRPAGRGEGKRDTKSIADGSGGRTGESDPLLDHLMALSDRSSSSSSSTPLTGNAFVMVVLPPSSSPPTSSSPSSADDDNSSRGMGTGGVASGAALVPRSAFFAFDRCAPIPPPPPPRAEYVLSSSSSPSRRVYRYAVHCATALLRHLPPSFQPTAGPSMVPPTDASVIITSGTADAIHIKKPQNTLAIAPRPDDKKLVHALVQSALRFLDFSLFGAAPTTAGHDGENTTPTTTKKSTSMEHQFEELFKRQQNSSSTFRKKTGKRSATGEGEQQLQQQQQEDLQERLYWFFVEHYYYYYLQQGVFAKNVPMGRLEMLNNLDRDDDMMLTRASIPSSGSSLDGGSSLASSSPSSSSFLDTTAYDAMHERWERRAALIQRWAATTAAPLPPLSPLLLLNNRTFPQGGGFPSDRNSNKSSSPYPSDTLTMKNRRRGYLHTGICHSNARALSYETVDTSPKAPSSDGAAVATKTKGSANNGGDSKATAKSDDAIHASSSSSSSSSAWWRGAVPRVPLPLSTPLLIQTLQNRRLFFLGDSIVRNSYVALSARICNYLHADECSARLPTADYEATQSDPRRRGPLGCPPVNDNAQSRRPPFPWLRPDGNDAFDGALTGDDINEGGQKSTSSPALHSSLQRPSHKPNKHPNRPGKALHPPAQPPVTNADDDFLNLRVHREAMDTLLEHLRGPSGVNVKNRLQTQKKTQQDKKQRDEEEKDQQQQRLKQDDDAKRQRQEEEKDMGAAEAALKAADTQAPAVTASSSAPAAVPESDHHDYLQFSPCHRHSEFYFEAIPKLTLSVSASVGSGAANSAKRQQMRKQQAKGGLIPATMNTYFPMLNLTLIYMSVIKPSMLELVAKHLAAAENGSGGGATVVSEKKTNPAGSSTTASEEGPTARRQSIHISDIYRTHDTSSAVFPITPGPLRITDARNSGRTPRLTRRVARSSRTEGLLPGTAFPLWFIPLNRSVNSSVSTTEEAPYQSLLPMPASIGARRDQRRHPRHHLADLDAVIVSIGPHLKLPQLLAARETIPRALAQLRAATSIPIVVGEFTHPLRAPMAFSDEIDRVSEEIRWRLAMIRPDPPVYVPHRFITAGAYYIPGSVFESDAKIPIPNSAAARAAGSTITGHTVCGYYDNQHPALRCQLALSELMMAAVLGKLQSREAAAATASSLVFPPQESQK